MPENAKKNELLYRVYVVLFVFVALAAVIAWKIIDISVVEGEYWKNKREERYMEWRPVPTLRGNIYADDAQSLLATSVEFFEIRMDPVSPRESEFYEQVDGLAKALAQYPGRRSAREWRDLLVSARKACIKGQKGCNRNILIARDVDQSGLEKLLSYPLFKLEKVAKYRGGFKKIKSFKRKKPFESLAARTVGEYRDANMVGLENSYDTVLKGEEKEALMQRFPGGLYVPVYDPTDFEIIKGRDIVTTINVPLQDIVHNELYKSVQEHNAEGAVAVLMEVKTGRIKAMSNLSRSKNGSIGEYHNYAFADRSEPGSTIKAASVLALLEDGFADENTLVDFNYGKKKFWDLWMKDSGSHGLKTGTLQMALEKSSNVGIASVMQEKYAANPEMYYDRMMQFGFDGPTGLDLEGEGAPYIKHPTRDKKIWYGTTIPWMAHGYELSMTPLQVLNFYNAVANDGKLMKPQLVQAIIYNEEVEQEFKPIVKRKSIASRDNINRLQRMLKGVVDNGTARSLRSDRYEFAGKTGTTKVGYSKADEEAKYNASFAGYWPADNPEYSMIVVVYGLKGAKYYGNVVAGPVFKRIMDWTFAIEGEELMRDEQVIASGDVRGYDGEIYGFDPDFDRVFDDLDVGYVGSGRWVRGGNDPEGDVRAGKAKITVDAVPDLSGMGARDAIYVLENLGMDVKLEGVGKVSRQSISPGKNIDNQVITLYLN